MKNIDETILVDKFIPTAWKCPHCKAENRTGVFANEVLVEHFKYIQHCENCGYLHIWKLRLTDKFKQGVVKILMGEEP